MQLKYPLDKTTKTLIANEARDEMKRSILDIVWGAYTYYSTYFDNDARFYTALVSGTLVVDSNGLVMTTEATTNAEAAGIIYAPDGMLLKKDKETRCRIITKIDTVSNTNFSMDVLGDGSSQNYIELAIESGVIKGGTDINGTLTTVNLGSVADATFVTLEFRYLPERNKVNFYVDGILKGTKETGLPDKTTDVEVLMDTGVGTLDDVAKESITNFFEIIQEK